MPIHHYFIYENFLIKLNVKLKLSKIWCENSFNTDIAFIYFKIKTLFSLFWSSTLTVVIILLYAIKSIYSSVVNMVLLDKFVANFWLSLNQRKCKEDFKFLFSYDKFCQNYISRDILNRLSEDHHTNRISKRKWQLKRNILMSRCRESYFESHNISNAL